MGWVGGVFMWYGDVLGLDAREDDATRLGPKFFSRTARAVEVEEDTMKPGGSVQE